MESTEPQLTSLLPNAVLDRVGRMRLNSARRFTNRARGEHLHGKGGTSTEFADYRDYVEGDDIRYVDWNIFARLQKPYLKLYQHEEEMYVVLLIDASTSMMFEDKLDRARQMAAVFSTMGLFANERVSIYVFTGQDDKMPMLPRNSGRGSMQKIFKYLENIEGGGDAPLEKGVEMMLKHHRGRGVAVILSDFLTYNNLAPALNRTYSSGLEVFGMQILGPTEIDPEMTEDLKLIDCENDAMLDVTLSGDLMDIYQEYRLRYQRHLELLCSQRSGKFLMVNSKHPIEYVVLDQLRRSGWVT